MKGIGASNEPTNTQSLTTEILQKVADREGCNPVDLRPSLYNHIDPDALNALFDPTASGQKREGGHVEITYCGYTITITNGRVRIRDSDEDVNRCQDGEVGSSDV